MVGIVILLLPTVLVAILMSSSESRFLGPPTEKKFGTTVVELFSSVLVSFLLLLIDLFVGNDDDANRLVDANGFVVVVVVDLELLSVLVTLDVSGCSKLMLLNGLDLLAVVVVDSNVVVFQSLLLLSV